MPYLKTKMESAVRPQCIDYERAWHSLKSILINMRNEVKDSADQMDDVEASVIDNTITDIMNDMEKEEHIFRTYVPVPSQGSIDSCVCTMQGCPANRGGRCSGRVYNVSTSVSMGQGTPYEITCERRVYI